MAHQEETLSKFIRRAVRPAADYTRLSLVQIVVGGGTNILRTDDLSKDTVYDSEKIDEMTADFLATAQEDADGRSGLSSFCVKALKGVTQGERSPTFRLRAQDSDINSEALGETEPATSAGLLGQLMRHLEADRRQTVQLVEVMSNQSTAVIARLTEQIKHYEDRHWETMVRAEELADERDNREMKKLKEVNREHRFDEALKTFKPLVPVLMSKLKGVPADAKAGLHMAALKEVIGDISNEDMEKIVNILGPKSLALGEIWLEAKQAEAQTESKH